MTTQNVNVESKNTQISLKMCKFQLYENVNSSVSWKLKHRGHVLSGVWCLLLFCGWHFYSSYTFRPENHGMTPTASHNSTSCLWTRWSFCLSGETLHPCQRRSLISLSQLECEQQLNLLHLVIIILMPAADSCCIAALQHCSTSKCFFFFFFASRVRFAKI